ncbi:MAG TPA: amidohydrolase/deacetylase family metallohydrolase [Bacteroidales bacterium]|nr:amidohydrolase/deacetylase family metallohydrolase [Bacteroidales bacterium]HPT20819.1 amidohydrolase/deacetylase family metallohydrolase [Bacteroidales bacterium]
MNINCLFPVNHALNILLNIRAVCFVVFFHCIFSSDLQAQEIDILLKGGHVIDPKNNIDAIMDVAVANGKILKVAPNISESNARQVVNASGLYVTPGLIDIHTHVFVGSKDGFADGFSSLSPDDFTFRAGITTVVDAGTSGWRNFPVFKKNVIDRSQTRVLAFLNIAGSGMTGFPSEEDINDMDSHMTSLVIKQYPDIIVGVKIGHYRGSEWTPFDRALEAGKIADVPLLVECHLPLLPLEDILGRMRPGDIYTHSFCTAADRTCILDEQGKIRPCVLEARKKGVLFDVGHGGAMFHFSVALPALKQRLLPDSFGSDLHRFSMNSGMKSMLDIMSKYLNMGMSIEDIIFRATWNPATFVKRPDLGNLSEGSDADIAVLNVRKGNFGFIDTGGNRMEGDRKLEAELTIRGGKVVWDLNGIAARKQFIK